MLAGVAVPLVELPWDAPRHGARAVYHSFCGPITSSSPQHEGPETSFTVAVPSALSAMSATVSDLSLPSPS